MRDVQHTNRQHAVPQNIMDVEFKIIGDLTMRQFVYLVTFGVLAYFCYAFFSASFRILPAIFFVLAGLALAFVPLQERGLDQWVISFFKSIYTPTQRIWRRDASLPVAFLYQNLDIVRQELVTLAPTSSRRKLEEYLGMQDSTVQVDVLDIPESEYVQKVHDAFATSTSPARAAATAPIKPPVFKSAPVEPKKEIRKEKETVSSDVSTARPSAGATTKEAKESFVPFEKKPAVVSVSPPMKASIKDPFAKKSKIKPEVPPRASVPNPFAKVPVTSKTVVTKHANSLSQKIPQKADSPASVFSKSLHVFKDKISTSQKDASRSTAKVQEKPAAPLQKPPVLEPLTVPQPEKPADDVRVAGLSKQVEELTKKLVALEKEKALKKDMPAQSEPTTKVAAAPISKQISKKPAVSVPRESSQDGSQLQIIKPRIIRTFADTKPGATGSFSLSPLTPDRHTGRRFTNLTPNQGRIDLPRRSQTVIPTSDITETASEKAQQLQKLVTQLKEEKNPQVRPKPLPQKGNQVQQSPLEKEYAQKELRDENAILRKKLAELQKEHTKVKQVPTSSDVRADMARELARQKALAKSEEVSLKTQAAAKPPVARQPIPEKQPTPMEALQKKPVFVKNKTLPARSNIISGIVKDSQGSVLGDVVLVIKNQNDEPVRALKTNKLGQFSISTALPNGTYTIETDKAGKTQLSFDIISVELTGKRLSPMEFVGY